MQRKPLEVIELTVDQLDPNPWNTNRMSDDMAAKLADYIGREGLVEPIVVRRKGERFEILGGYHRWKICSERLGFKTMPCVVLDLDDHRAKILSVNLNEMSGEPVPSLVANLLHDLNRESNLEDLERLLPYAKAEMADMLQILRLPEGLEARLEEEAKRLEEERPVIVSIALSRTQNAMFETALERVRAEIGDGSGWKGRALERLATAYLERSQASGDVGLSMSAAPNGPSATTAAAGTSRATAEAPDPLTLPPSQSVPVSAPASLPEFQTKGSAT